MEYTIHKSWGIPHDYGNLGAKVPPSAVRIKQAECELLTFDLPGRVYELMGHYI